MGRWVPKRSKCFGACGLWAERQRLVSMLLIFAACRKTQVHSQGALFPELRVAWWQNRDTREARSFYWSCEATKNQRDITQVEGFCALCVLLGSLCNMLTLSPATERVLASASLNCTSVFEFEHVLLISFVSLCCILCLDCDWHSVSYRSTARPPGPSASAWLCRLLRSHGASVQSTIRQMEAQEEGLLPEMPRDPVLNIVLRSGSWIHWI